MTTYTSRNPARFDDIVVEVPLATVADVVATCQAAKDAQPGWAAVPAPARGRVIAQVGRLFEANKESLSRLVTREMGKVYAEALGDVQEVIDTCDFFLGEGRRLYGQTVPSEMPDKQLFTFRVPVGTAMIITAGNFPAVVGLPGVHNLTFWSSDAPVRVVGVRHEQAAVYAADGYARA
ncbi:MAG: aldehyde dehydrogenase family protein, partial [Actinomycetota bacterium]